MGARETNRGFSVSMVDTTVLTGVTTETTLFSQVIPAGKMGTSKKLSFTALCLLTTGSLSLPTLTIKAKLGNATFTIANNIGLALSQNNTPFVIEGSIRNKEANNVQIVYAKTTQAGSSLPMLLANASAIYADWAVDTSVDQTFSITAQLSVTSGNTTLTLKDVDLDLS